jgi:hypothetical protein
VRIVAWPADRPKNYARYGLEKPSAVLTVKTRAGADETKTSGIFTVQFGALTRGGRRCYARVAGEPNVYEVSANILGRIRKGTLEFRDKTVLKFKKADVSQVRVEGGRTDYTVSGRYGGRWMLSRPPLGLGNEHNVRQLIDTLHGLAAKELVCEAERAKPEWGLQPKRPYRKVTLVLERPRKRTDAGTQPPPADSRTLIVGAQVPGEEKGDRYARVIGGEFVFVIGAGDVEKLDLELVTTRIIDIDEKRVETVTVAHRDGSKVAVARRGLDWRVTSHRGVEGDAARIRALVAGAALVTAESYAAYDNSQLSRYGLEKPLLKVTVKPRGKLPAELIVGNEVRKKGDDERPAGGRRYYATGGGVSAVFVLPGATVDKLRVHVEDLMRRKPR